MAESEKKNLNGTKPVAPKPAGAGKPAQEKPAAKKTASPAPSKKPAPAGKAVASGDGSAEKKQKPADPVRRTAVAKKPAAKPAETDLKASGLKALNAVKKMAGKAAGSLSERIREARAAKRDRPAKKPLSKKALKRRKKRIQRIIRRSALCVVTALLVAVLGVYMVLFTVFHGPSQTASDLLVNTVTETSALKFVPYLFFSEEEVAAILARNAIEVPDEPTDTSMIVIDRSEKPETGEDGEPEKDIELVEVNGPTYHGYMMIVKDPSRVSLATCCDDFDSEYGKYINEMADEAGAIAAINAGGFEDENGGGRGGKPLGVVVRDGKVLNRKYSRECDTLIGFDRDDKLIVGLLNADDAERLGIRDAASFNPILVLNGEPAEVKGSSSGLNPRTAIGQRADGAVLLLVIDGRQVNSLGASLADLIDIMMQFGAVNAANLDGGSSSKMYYNGEFVNEGVALTGSRRLPTAFIVK